jgi:Protein of unknown function (DUF3102)
LVLKRRTADILSIGSLLAEAKEKIPRGQWLPWLKKECSMSERSAQNYVKAAEFAAKYATVADLNLSPSALFLISRHDRREIVDAVVKAAKEKHLGCDQVKEIVDKTLAELNVANEDKTKGNATGNAPQDARRRSGVNPSDYLLLRFTAAIVSLNKITKNGQAERFAKIPVEADILARLGQLLTDLADLKAKRAALEAYVDKVA